MSPFSPEEIRLSSINTATELGYPINHDLPLSDFLPVLRSKDDIVTRTICLHCVAACAWGYSKNEALSWLEREKLLTHVTSAEKAFLAKPDEEGDEVLEFKVRPEAIWALLWVLSVVSDLDFSIKCGDNTIDLVPAFWKRETTYNFRSRSSLRETHEILTKADLAFCLHWAIRQASLDGLPPPGKVKPYVIVERRRALEWLFSEEPWDEVPLDT